MASPRYRPSRKVFEALCRHYSQAEIAEICGVSRQAVGEWQKEYGCQARRQKTGPKPPSEPAFQAALKKGLQTHRVC